MSCNKGKQKTRLHTEAGRLYWSPASPLTLKYVTENYCFKMLVLEFTINRCLQIWIYKCDASDIWLFKFCPSRTRIRCKLRKQLSDIHLRSCPLCIQPEAWLKLFGFSDLTQLVTFSLIKASPCAIAGILTSALKLQACFSCWPQDG